MKKSTIIIAIMALYAKPVYSGVYISDIGFGAECNKHLRQYPVVWVDS